MLHDGSQWQTVRVEDLYDFLEGHIREIAVGGSQTVNRMPRGRVTASVFGVVDFQKQARQLIDVSIEQDGNILQGIHADHFALHSHAGTNAKLTDHEERVKERWNIRLTALLVIQSSAW
jgi:hypothetical protein